MIPRYWTLQVNGIPLPKRYAQRGQARGAAMVLRAQGNLVIITPHFVE